MPFTGTQKTPFTAALIGKVIAASGLAPLSRTDLAAVAQWCERAEIHRHGVRCIELMTQLYVLTDAEASAITRFHWAALNVAYGHTIPAWAYDRMGRVAPAKAAA